MMMMTDQYWLTCSNICPLKCYIGLLGTFWNKKNFELNQSNKHLNYDNDDDWSVLIDRWPMWWDYTAPEQGYQLIESEETSWMSK